MFYWGAQEQPQTAIPTQPWLSSSSSSPNSSRPSTPNSSMSAALDRPQSPSCGPLSPTEAAGIIVLLKDKSVDELRKLLTDKEAYNNFLYSIEQVRTQNAVRDELWKATFQLARENLDKEPQILELKNQCQVIRSTELADAQQKLCVLEKQKEEILRLYAPSTLLRRMQDAMNAADEECERLHGQLLEREIELGAFLPKYKKLRTVYHRRSLLHLAAKASYG
ncbi:hypothetical protein AMTRI_Chr07g27670 [Amborella trichopoda]